MDGYYDQGSGYFTLWVNAVKGVGAQLADIHIENGGQVKVLNWGVGVTGNRVGDGQGIKVSGDNLNARSISVEKVQISSITGYQSGDIDFNNAVQNASGQALLGVTGKPTQDVEPKRWPTA